MEIIFDQHKKLSNLKSFNLYTQLAITIPMTKILINLISTINSQMSKKEEAANKWQGSSKKVEIYFQDLKPIKK